MASEWYYQIMGQQFGPVSAVELHALANAGTVARDTLVRKGGEGRWVCAEKVQGLFQRSDSRSPPPSTPLAAVPPIPECGAPNKDFTCDSSIRAALPPAPADDSPENGDRTWPLTWAAIIVGAGTVLLLLWAMVFRGSSTPEQKQLNWDDFSDRAEDVRQPAQPVAKQSVTQHRPREDKLSPPELYKHISPCVVCVENYDDSDKLVAFGSGFFVSGDGRVATNLHVIQGAHKVAVCLNDGTTLPLRIVIGMDQDNDLAVLDIGGTGHDFIPISTRLPEVGTRVYAIGNPEGLDNSLSEGIVSGWRKIDDVLFIQITAAISAGSSGGPLLSPDGTVIGITTASLHGGQSLNLAIPASMLRSLLDKAQQPFSLAQLNAKLGGGEHRQTTIEDESKAISSAWNAIRARKYGEAMKTLERVPDTRRGSGSWIATGHIHFMLENLQAAQADFSRAVAIDQDNVEALLRLALAYRFSVFSDDSNKSWDATRALCKRVLEVEPTNAQAYCILGITCVSSDETIGFLKTASALDPKNFAAQYNLGYALLGEGRNEEAIRPLSAALDLERETDYRFVPNKFTDRPESISTSCQIMIKLMLARAYNQSEQYERAVKAYKEVLAIEPKNQLAPLGLCLTYRGWRKNFKHPDALHWENAAEAARGLSDKGTLLLRVTCFGFPQIITLGRSN